MLVSTEAGGLGNRIKSWVSATRLDPKARVYWPITSNMPASFADLFANDCGIDELPADATSHCSWRLAVTDADLAELPEGFATAGGGAHPLARRAGKLWWSLRGAPDDRYRFMITPKRFSKKSTRRDGRIIDFEYNRIPDYFRNLYAPYFVAITVQPEIVRRADAWSATNFDAAVIGVQVRTWRDDPRRHRKHHKPAVARLKRLLQTTDQRNRFFVVSDDDDVAPWLATEVGADRVLSFPRETARRASWQSVQGMSEDLIDMILLSRTHRMFASYLSTFSETAWWLGGASAEVAVF